MKSIRKDEVGNRYGMLTVIEYAERSKWKQARWRCLCDCGNITVVDGGSLRSGHTKSCGCLQREMGRKHSSLPFGQASFNLLYRDYTDRAKKNGVRFEITKEDFGLLTKMGCFYCGSAPSRKRCKSKHSGAYLYNGLDRIDPNMGYTMDNVVPCCWECNKLKSNKTLQEFKQQILEIVKHRNWEVGK